MKAKAQNDFDGFFGLKLSSWCITCFVDSLPALMLRKSTKVHSIYDARTRGFVIFSKREQRRFLTELMISRLKLKKILAKSGFSFTLFCPDSQNRDNIYPI